MPQDRTAAILRAALSEFAIKGLSGARMDDIARAAGLSKGSIYRYFPDKDALFAATIQSTLEELLGRGGGGTPSDRQLFLRRAWATAADPRFRAAYRLSLTTDPTLSHIRENAEALIDQALVKPFAALLGQTERESTLPHDDPLLRSRLTFATLLGTALTITSTPQSMDAGIAFLLRACELEAQSPQADGF